MKTSQTDSKKVDTSSSVSKSTKDDDASFVSDSTLKKDSDDASALSDDDDEDRKSPNHLKDAGHWCKEKLKDLRKDYRRIRDGPDPRRANFGTSFQMQPRLHGKPGWNLGSGGMGAGLG